MAIVLQVAEIEHNVVVLFVPTLLLLSLHKYS